jgi:hypothetical protein
MALTTYSEAIGGRTLGEDTYRAANNDVVAYSFEDHAIAMRAAYPTTKLFSYNHQRKAVLATAQAWDAYADAHSISRELGYIHHGTFDPAGRRHYNGDPSDFFIMNMGNASYVNFLRERALKCLEGTVFGSPGQHPGLVVDGILIDETLWYPAFDTVATENIKTSLEYASSGPTFRKYQDDCVAAFLATIAHVSANYPGKIVFPNFGNLAFVGVSNDAYGTGTAANTAAVIAASSVIEAQAVLDYTNGEPNINSAVCESYWAMLAAHAGKTIMGHGRLVSPTAQVDIDRAKLGVCAWMMIGSQPPGFCARFAIMPTTTDPVADIATWEQPQLFRAVSAAMGQATGAYSVVAGSWTKAKVYKRTFEHGIAYFCARVTSGSEAAPTFTVPSGRPYQADGSFGLPTTDLTLSIGEGAILVDTAIVATDLPAIGTSDDVLALGTMDDVCAVGTATDVLAEAI